MQAKKLSLVYNSSHLNDGYKVCSIRRLPYMEERDYILESLIHSLNVFLIKNYRIDFVAPLAEGRTSITAWAPESMDLYVKQDSRWNPDMVSHQRDDNVTEDFTDFFSDYEQNAITLLTEIAMTYSVKESTCSSQLCSFGVETRYFVWARRTFRWDLGSFLKF